MDDPTTLIVTSGQVGSMANTNDLTTEIDKPSRRHRFGLIALTLWAIAIAFVPVDMAYATGRTLTFSRDLLTITTVSASLATLLWYLDRNLVAHLLNWRIGIEYGYRSGYRDRSKEMTARCNASDNLANVFVIEPLQHPQDRRTIPEMHRTGDHAN